MTLSTRQLKCIIPLWASLIFASVSATVGFHSCPRCLPIEIHDAPGVGFDLTTDYGISSVKMYNGSTNDLANVEATQEYKDLFIRLSSAPKLPPVPPPTRWLNKNLGLPKTALGLSLNKIVLAHPRFPALTAEDIGEAIEHAGLQSWLHLPNDDLSAPNQLSENRAALAAHGFNLCQEYASWSICFERMCYEALPVTVYFVSLTESALYTSLDTYLQPFEYIRDYEPHFFDSKLGLDHMSSYPSEDAYWSAIQNGLVPPDTTHPRPISHVLIGGEAATMPEFRAALRDALVKASVPEERIVSTNSITHEEISPVYAAARGAALLARWRQEAPLNCHEILSECGEIRRLERKSKEEPPLQERTEL